MDTQTALRNRCVICDRIVANPNDRRETPCGRVRHAACAILLDSGRTVSCDCFQCSQRPNFAQ